MFISHLVRIIFIINDNIDGNDDDYGKKMVITSGCKMCFNNLSPSFRGRFLPMSVWDWPFSSESIQSNNNSERTKKNAKSNSIRLAPNYYYYYYYRDKRTILYHTKNKNIKTLIEQSSSSLMMMRMKIQ